MAVSARRADREARTLGVARRAAFVFAGWLGFWLLAAGIVLALLAIPYVQLRYDSFGLGGILAFVAAISLVIALFRPRGRDRDATPTPLPRERVPELYERVERIGARAGVRAPVAIHLGFGVNASIGADRTWYGRIRKLDVSLGYGLLGLLDEEEVDAVVAHEFGHMAKGDLGLTPWVYRTRNALGGTLYQLDSSPFLLDAPFRLYAHVFLRQSASLSRAQEYEADALAASLAGVDAAADALRRVHAASAEWDVYTREVLTPAINRGARLPVLDGFRKFRASERRRPALLQAIARERDAPPDPRDTHPSLEERLAALGRSGIEPVPSNRNALRLLGGEAAGEALCYEWFTKGELTPVDWDSFGERVLAPAIRERFDQTFLDPVQVSLQRLPELAQDHEALWNRTKPDGISLLSPQARARHVFAVLEEFAIAALHRCGWTLHVVPGEAWRMRRGEQEVLPDQLMLDVREGRIDAPSLARLETSASSPTV